MSERPTILHLIAAAPSLLHPKDADEKISAILLLMPRKEKLEWAMACEASRAVLLETFEAQLMAEHREFLERINQAHAKLWSLTGSVPEHCATQPTFADPRDSASTPSQPPRPPKEGFPRFWELFPIILPKSVRETVYEPCVEELKEDYLRERARWKGRFSRRWVTFCFTVRTVNLVFQSLWAATLSKTRKVLLGALTVIVGSQYAEAIRMRLAQWFGLM